MGLRTAAALCAFAGNSILTRLALGETTIDAVTFATVRVASGAVMLLLVTAVTGIGARRASGAWRSAAALFFYAVVFIRLRERDRWNRSAHPHRIRSGHDDAGRVPVAWGPFRFSEGARRARSSKPRAVS